VCTAELNPLKTSLYCFILTYLRLLYIKLSQFNKKLLCQKWRRKFSKKSVCLLKIYIALNDLQEILKQDQKLRFLTCTIQKLPEFFFNFFFLILIIYPVLIKPLL